MLLEFPPLISRAGCGTAGAELWACAWSQLTSLPALTLTTVTTFPKDKNPAAFNGGPRVLEVMQPAESRG